LLPRPARADAAWCLFHSVAICYLRSQTKAQVVLQAISFLFPSNLLKDQADSHISNVSTATARVKLELMYCKSANNLNAPLVRIVSNRIESNRIELNHTKTRASVNQMTVQQLPRTVQ
jgi:hypothetical protein